MLRNEIPRWAREGAGYPDFHAPAIAAGVQPGHVLSTGTYTRSGQPLVLTVEADRHLLLPGPASWLITCRSGLVWVTREGCLDDWVLRGGESMRLQGRGIILGALRDSELELLPDAPAQVRHVGALRALAGLLARRLINRR